MIGQYNLGEAAHIKAARKGQARYEPNMTDEERGDISNGIWLCKECARKIDLDEKKYPVDSLHIWKQKHEGYVMAGKPSTNPAREVTVCDGGIGSIVQNTDDGIGLDINHKGEGPAEKITVEGKGVGEIITNTGHGIGKRIISAGGGTASENQVIVNMPVQVASGLSVTTVITTCGSCGSSIPLSKVIQGFAGDSEPEVKVNCPRCGKPVWI